MTKDADAFIKELEERFNDKVKYKTFCTWYSDNEMNVRNRGVFLSIFSSFIFLEDFEPEAPDYLSIILHGKVKKEKYEKFEKIIDIASIKSFNVVSKSDVEKAPTEKQNEANIIQHLLSRLVCQLELNNGLIINLEVINKNEFKKALGL